MLGKGALPLFFDLPLFLLLNSPHFFFMFLLLISPLSLFNPFTIVISEQTSEPALRRRSAWEIITLGWLRIVRMFLFLFIVFREPASKRLCFGLSSCVGSLVLMRRFVVGSMLCTRYWENFIYVIVLFVMVTVCISIFWISHFPFAHPCL